MGNKKSSVSLSMLEVIFGLIRSEWKLHFISINWFCFPVQFKSEERSLNDSRERSLEQDTRQELTQKVLLSFARQIAVGMVTKFYNFIYKFQSLAERT